MVKDMTNEDTAGSTTATSARRVHPALLLLLPFLLLGVWGGTAAFASSKAESITSQTSDSLDAALRAQKRGHVTKHVFSKGMTSSQDDLYLSINWPNQDGHITAQPVHVHSVISSGPFGIGGTTVDTTLIQDPGPKPSFGMGDSGGDLDSIIRVLASRGAHVRTTVGLGGHTTSQVFLPEGTIPRWGGHQRQSISWKGLTGQVSSDGTLTTTNANLHWGGFTYTSENGPQLTVEDVAYQQEQTPYLAHLSTGTVTIDVGKVIMAGSTSSGVRIQSGIAVQNNAVNTAVTFNLGSFAVPGRRPFSDVSLMLTAKGLNGEALDRMYAKLRDPANSDVVSNVTSRSGTMATQDAAPFISLVSSDAQQILNGNLKVELTGSMVTDAGKSSLSLKSEVTHDSQLDAANLIRSTLVRSASPTATETQATLKALHLDAEASVPIKAIEEGMGSPTGDTGTADMLIGTVVNQGMADLNNGVLHSHATLREGQLLLNGRNLNSMLR